MLVGVSDAPDSSRRHRDVASVGRAGSRGARNANDSYYTARCTVKCSKLPAPLPPRTSLPRIEPLT